MGPFPADSDPEDPRFGCYTLETPRIASIPVKNGALSREKSPPNKVDRFPSETHILFKKYLFLVANRGDPICVFFEVDKLKSL